MTVDREGTATADPAASPGSLRVCCFDLYAGGHHREFAGELARGLRRYHDCTVDLLFVAPGDHDAEHIDPAAVTYLYDRSPLEGVGFTPSEERLAAPSRFLATGVLDARSRVLRDVAAHLSEREYDVVHCLEVDKLLPSLLCGFAKRVDAPTVGTINGVYYKPTTAPLALSGRLGKPLRVALEGRTRCPLLRALPPVLRKGDEWNQWALDRCLAEGVLDALTVPTEAGRDALLDRADASIHGASRELLAGRVALAPDPLELWPGRDDPATQERARGELELPADATILLSFGRLVAEKGIDTLLAALERYDGPPVTVVLAGQPIAVDKRDVAAIDAAPAVDLVARLGYVPESAMRSYFLAADGIVLPYGPSFGERRPSNVFQKACAAGRPVIASDLGTFSRRVRRWELGLLVEPESPSSLAAGLREFVERDGDVADPDRMTAYAETQTYERLAAVVHDAYRSALE